MNIASPLPIGVDPPPPQVFSRVFSTPPGPPWRQARAAKLEAWHGAPIPIADLIHRVKRLNPWAAGAPGRYAAFYVRAREFSAPFETTVEVDGRQITVAFGAPALPLARAGAVGALLVAILASLTLLGAGFWLGLSARMEVSARLDIAEQTAAARSRSMTQLKRRADQARALRVVVGSNRPIGALFDDLRWVSVNKAPDARIDALHWDHGLLVVEARGESPPFLAPDRTLRRSDKPIRRGVWLWGVVNGPTGASQ